MKYLLILLICIFTFFIIYQINLEFSDNLIEGLENETENQYKSYDTNDPNNALILAQQNSGNIIVLKQQVDELTTLKKQFNDLKEHTDSMQVQLDNLVQQQADYAHDLAGSNPPDISGTDEMTTNDI